MKRIIYLEKKAHKSGSSGTYGKSKGSNDVDSMYDIKKSKPNHKRNNSDAVNSIISVKGFLNATFDAEFEDNSKKRKKKPSNEVKFEDYFSKKENYSKKRVTRGKNSKSYGGYGKFLDSKEQICEQVEDKSLVIVKPTESKVRDTI